MKQVFAAVQEKAISKGCRNEQKEYKSHPVRIHGSGFLCDQCSVFQTAARSYGANAYVFLFLDLFRLVLYWQMEYLTADLEKDENVKSVLGYDEVLGKSYHLRYRYHKKS